jgi:uncharacterized membrane protein
MFVFSTHLRKTSAREATRWNSKGGETFVLRHQGVSRMTNPKSSAQIAGHPIHPMLVPFPIAFLVGTFVSDIVFSGTRDTFWATASYWLLAAALVMAALAAIAGLIDFLGESRIRTLRAAWYHMVGNVVAVVLSLANFCLRYENGITGSYPTVLWISLAVTLLLLFNGWKGWELVYRHRVGIADDDIS